MKKNYLLLVLALAGAMVFTGCKKEDEASEAPVVDVPTIQVVTETPTITTQPEETAADDDEVREGMYRSELTNEWIDEALQDQRPIAVMVDNEKTALPHYGLSTADIVYEMTNSIENDGVTRFMVLVKDWEQIQQLGSIRSTRPTNLVIAPEWNAVVCHDGGPFYIDDYLANDYVENFSGTFSRVDNGKAREFTEYILPGDLDKNFSSKNYSKTYNQYYQGPHFQFTSASKPNDLSEYSDVKDCTHIQMPFKHNKPYFDYDEASQTYKYSEYGSAHVDPGNNNEQLAFTNLLIQNARYVVFDDNGYMMFHAKDYDREGWYITKGKAVKVTWSKDEDINPTHYYDENHNEIVLNTGKTYISLVPDDLFDEIEIK